MTLSGGCNCGAVRFEVEGEVKGAGYCHCSRCQRRSGTAAAPSIFVATGQFRLVQGEDVIRSWSPEEGNQKWFCPECGSPVYASNAALTFVAVRMGVLDEDPGVRPQIRVHTSSAAPWEPIPDDGLTRFPAGVQA